MKFPGRGRGHRLGHWSSPPEYHSGSCASLVILPQALTREEGFLLNACLDSKGVGADKDCLRWWRPSPQPISEEREYHRGTTVQETKLWWSIAFLDADHSPAVLLSTNPPQKISNVLVPS